MFVAHYIPWRAIRAGKQLSDSKGASAAISTEAAVLCAKRALKGFIGPKDIFRNPESMFRQFVKTNGDSPFDLHLSHSGDDFAVMGMHFKLGLYEHQSAGALQSVVDLLIQRPDFVNSIRSITIKAYEPAFGIIGDPAKRDPKTRQSADHSMVFIVARFIHKAQQISLATDNDSIWKSLMLMPLDYGKEAIFDPATRAVMEKIQFEHGGDEYDHNYPDGIPTSMVVTLEDGTVLDSGLCMYPSGHARNVSAGLQGILNHKFALLGSIALPDGGDVQVLVDRLNQLPSLSAEDLMSIYEFDIAVRPAVD
jgi:2-methylcitrate dehydratase